MLGQQEFIPKPAGTNLKQLNSIRMQLQQLMQKNVGITRNDTDLFDTKIQLKYWQTELALLKDNYAVNKEFYELKNMIEVSLCIVQQSIERQENRGGFIKK